MRYHTSLFATALFTLAAAPLALMAQTAPTLPTPAEIAQRTAQRYAILLGLDATQQSTVVTILTTEQTSLATLRTAEKTAHENLLTAIKANNIATITELSGSLGTLNGQDTLARATAESSIYALLSADQQTKFLQILLPGPGGQGGPAGGPMHP